MNYTTIYLEHIPLPLIEQTARTTPGVAVNYDDLPQGRVHLQSRDPHALDQACEALIHAVALGAPQTQ